MFFIIPTCLYTPPHPSFCCVLPFCACSSCDFVMWLLHGADDVASAGQQKVTFWFCPLFFFFFSCLSSSEMIRVVFDLVSTAHSPQNRNGAAGDVSLSHLRRPIGSNRKCGGSSTVRGSDPSAAGPGAAWLPFLPCQHVSFATLVTVQARPPPSPPVTNDNDRLVLRSETCVSPLFLSFSLPGGRGRKVGLINPAN